MDSTSSRRNFLQNASRSAALVSAASMLPRLQASSSSAPRIKVGQIGVGHAHAAGKMETLRNSADWEVVGVVEADQTLRNEAQSADVYRDLTWMNEEQLLGVPGLQAVVVETACCDSLEVAEHCVAAGMHLHLDKPPGANLDRLRRLLASADRQQLTVQMGYMYRYNPGIVLLKEFLGKGWLGEPFEVHAVMSKEVGEAKRRRWRTFPGGSMFELGCHLIDLVVGILGVPEDVTPFNRHSGQFDDGLLDNMLSVFSYPKATATVRSTALEVEGFDRRHLVVCGTEGTMHIQPLDDPQVQLALSQPRGGHGKEYHQINLPEYTRYIDDLADLAQIIRGEKDSDFDSAHDLVAQESLLKACRLL